MTKNAQVQYSSVAHSRPTLCDPMNCRTPGLPVHHQLPEFIQIHIHRVSDAIQPSHPLHPLLLLPRIPPSIRVFSNDSFPNLFLCMYSLRPHQALGEAEDLGDLMVLEGEGIQPSTLREGFSIHRAESWSLLKER